MPAPKVLIILYPALYYYYVWKWALEKGSRWRTDWSGVICARRAVNQPQTLRFHPDQRCSCKAVCVFTSPWKRQCDLLIGCWWLNVYSLPRAVRIATPLNSNLDFFNWKLVTSSGSFRKGSQCVRRSDSLELERLSSESLESNDLNIYLADSAAYSNRWLWIWSEDFSIWKSQCVRSGRTVWVVCTEDRQQNMFWTCTLPCRQLSTLLIAGCKFVPLEFE